MNEPFIIIFRGGKYWQFDNKPEEGKPFGTLVTGGTLARIKWPAIRFPGGVGNNKDKFIVIYDKTWSQWFPNGDLEFDQQPIVENEDSPGTAVVLPDNRIAIVIKDEVILFLKKIELRFCERVSGLVL
jgi:hypothetical protein